MASSAAVPTPVAAPFSKAPDLEPFDADSTLVYLESLPRRLFKDFGTFTDAALESYLWW